MRTTLTLETDVERRLREVMRQTGHSFKETVNTLLRLGLAAAEEPPPNEPFVVEARELRARPGVDFDDIGGLLDRIDGPYRR